MARRAATPASERRPVARRKDAVRELLDKKLWEAVEDPRLTVAESQEAVRQIERIHKMWGWAS